MDQITPAITREAVPFDYGAMDQETADEARAMVARVRLRVKSYYMDTGRELMSMKDRLNHGLFQRWVEAEMGMTPRTALNMMQAAAEFGHKSETVSHLPAAVLYKLAAPSTPATVRDEIVSRLEKGEALTPKAIDLRLREVRGDVRQAKADAKLAPEERKRQAQAKKAAEARRQREHEKSQQEHKERQEWKAAATQEVAQILASRLDDKAFKEVIDLLRECELWRLPDALSDAYGPLVGEGEGDDGAS